MCGPPGFDRKTEQQQPDDGEHHQLLLPRHATHGETVTALPGFRNLEKRPLTEMRPGCRQHSGNLLNFDGRGVGRYDADIMNDESLFIALRVSVTRSPLAWPPLTA